MIMRYYEIQYDKWFLIVSDVETKKIIRRVVRQFGAVCRVGGNPT